MFFLPHDIPPTPKSQDLWRYCEKCHVMFYDGRTTKGSCGAGGGHQSQGYMFVLPHDIPATDTAQDLWRYCEKCYTMFWDGYANKGRCPSDGAGHVAQGYMFVLPHDIPNSLQWDVNSITFSDPLVAANGDCHLTINQDGTCQFWGHYNDSGTLPYDMSTLMTVFDSQSRLYTFNASGSVAGSLTPGAVSYDWTIPVQNQAIADNWASIAAGSSSSQTTHADFDLTSLWNAVKQDYPYVVEVISVIGAVFG